MLSEFIQILGALLIAISLANSSWRSKKRNRDEFDDADVLLEELDAGSIDGIHHGLLHQRLLHHGLLLHDGLLHHWHPGTK